MENRVFSIFEKREINIPIDVLEKYEDTVGQFNQNTINHLIVVLGLSEKMTDAEISSAIIESMLEDCNDSVLFSRVLAKEKNVKGLLGGQCYKLDSET